MSVHSLRYLAAAKDQSYHPHLSQSTSQISLGTKIAQHLRRSYPYVAIWQYDDGTQLMISKAWLAIGIICGLALLFLIGALLYRLFVKHKNKKAARNPGDTEKDALDTSPGSPAAGTRAASVAAPGTRAASMAAPGTRAASMAAPGTRAPSVAAPGTRAASMAVPDAAAADAADAVDADAVDAANPDAEIPAEATDAIPPATRTASIAPV